MNITSELLRNVAITVVPGERGATFGHKRAGNSTLLPASVVVERGATLIRVLQDPDSIPRLARRAIVLHQSGTLADAAVTRTMQIRLRPLL